MLTNKFACITDVPTPYRVHLFDAMAREFEARGIAFEVYFMARTVPIRSWELSPSDWHFVHHFPPGLHWTPRSTTFHFNPTLVSSIVRDAPRWVMVGGGWHLPTATAMLAARSVQRAATTFLWAEANRASMTIRSGPAHLLRRFIANLADGFVVPGRIAVETLKEDWGLSDKPTLKLPNLIDEKLFGTKVGELRLDRGSIRAKWGLSAGEFAMLWPARLDERTKGILNFLRAVKELLNSRVRILIPGTGPDRGDIEAWIASNSISSVRLLGWQPEDKMLELYAASDFFVLPSLMDPNPLSVIEALWAGLPVLISDRCGNWPEAVEQGMNGWIVDPSSPVKMRDNLAQALRMTTEQLADAGAASARLAAERFDTERNVRSFVSSVVS